uniref:Ubiquitin-like protease family profile domain-containing protein n=1 Tax=Cucumis melo TaxID=3656 RepID=A0A9I9EHR2_CUCME
MADEYVVWVVSLHLLFIFIKQSQESQRRWMQPNKLLMKMKHFINVFESWNKKFKASQHRNMVVAPRAKSKRRDHWSLVIINPYDDLVYHLDSLRTSSRDDIKYVTNMALTIFQSQKNLKKTRKTTFWKAVKVGTVECGYYVMRYMREILSKDTSIITDAIDTRNSYSQLELDESSQQDTYSLERLSRVRYFFKCGLGNNFPQWLKYFDMSTIIYYLNEHTIKRPNLCNQINYSYDRTTLDFVMLQMIHNRFLSNNNERYMQELHYMYDIHNSTNKNQIIKMSQNNIKLKVNDDNQLKIDDT